MHRARHIELEARHRSDEVVLVEHKLGERRQSAAFEQSLEDLFVGGQDFDAKEKWHDEGKRGHSKPKNKEVVVRAPNLRNPITKEFAASGEDFGEIADSFASLEHGTNLGRR